MKILLVDDEKLLTVPLADALKEKGHSITVCQDGSEALNCFRQTDYDIIIADIRMPGLDGFSLLEAIKKLQPDAIILFITAYANVKDAVRAIKEGAHDYIQKPFMNKDLIEKVEQLESFIEAKKIKEQIDKHYEFHEIIGRSKPMRNIFQIIELVSKSDCPCLIEGESGTGKALVARAIHCASSRSERPFVEISCSNIPDTLIESELFGYVKGAFTDATKDKPGKFELANEGTVFIDDVDDLTSLMQVKLLRVLQTKEFERIGDNKTMRVNVRVLAASKVNLWDLVKEKRFREDLYFRINVVKIVLPPLRERVEDIPILVQHFLRKISRGIEYRIDPDILQLLQAYSWPGNIRELENAIERAVVMAGKDGIIRKEHLVMPLETVKYGTQASLMSRLEDVVANAEVNHIKNILRMTDNNKTRAAEILGISRKELWVKMKKYEIE